MQSTLTPATLGLLSLAVFGLAQAQGGRTFSQLDRNQDSLVSVSEAQADEFVRTRFGQVDVNGDGFVSRAEFTTWRKEGGGDRSAPSRSAVPPGATAPGPQNNPEIDAPPAR